MDKLEEIKEYVLKRFEVVDAETDEINERVESDDWCPMDASGGNFNDAYDMGRDHGESFGEYKVLAVIKEILEKVGDALSQN